MTLNEKVDPLLRRGFFFLEVPCRDVLFCRRGWEEENTRIDFLGLVAAAGNESTAAAVSLRMRNAAGHRAALVQIFELALDG